MGHPTRTRVRSRSALLVGPAVALLVLGAAPPAQAVINVSGGSVSGDGADDAFVVTCAAGVLNVTGVTGDACATLDRLDVYPGDGTDSVDLSGVTAAAFPALLSLNVDVSDDHPHEADSVLGSPLDDVITGDTADALVGDGGNDLLTGGGSVSGGLGDDTIVEFNGASVASGGPGDDRFVQFIPQAGIEGGAGLDSWEVDFDRAAPNSGANDLNVSLGAELLRVQLGPLDESVPINGVEQVYWTLLRGNTQTFDGTGFPGMLHIRGMAGIDIVTGGTGDDVLHGGRDNDVITGGPGLDELQGGEGDDTINARDGQVDQVDCGPGTDSVVADREDQLTGCESVDVPPAPAPPTPPTPPVPPVVVPPAPPAPAAPETSAVSGKKKVAKPKKAKFRFSSATPGATFECKLDKGKWKACSSVHKVKTKKLKAGKHTLRVRARLGDMVDATPSKKAFKVKRRRR